MTVYVRSDPWLNGTHALWADTDDEAFMAAVAVGAVGTFRRAVFMDQYDLTPSQFDLARTLRVVVVDAAGAHRVLHPIAN